MTVNLVMGLGLAVALVNGFIIWQCDKLRARLLFHVIGLVAAAGLYATMVWWSASAEIVPGRVPGVFIFRVVVGAVPHFPFLAFLVVSYIRLLGGVAGGSMETTTMKVEDAEQAFRFGHNTRAVKLLREVLDADPDHVDARVLMAQIQFKRGHYNESIGSYRLAMGVTPDSAKFAELVFRTAVILNESLGDAKAACTELDLIRQRMPDTPEAKKAQAWILRIMEEDARES